MKDFATGVNFCLLVAIVWGLEPGTGGRIAAAIVLLVGFWLPVQTALLREFRRKP